MTLLLLTACSGSATDLASPAATAPTRDSLSLVGELPSPVSAGEDFAPLSVELRDADGKEVSGATVTFSVKNGQAAFAAGIVTDVTDQLGVATAAGLTAGTTPGPVEVAVAAADKSTLVRLEVK